MKHLARLTAALAGLVLAGAACGQGSSPPPSWPEALDAAWQRSRTPAERQAQLRRAEAERDAARPWAGAPSLQLDHLQGRASQRETEVGVAVPVWLPAQRQARQRAADAAVQAARAGLAAARLALAGELRDAAGTLLAQQAEARQAELQVRLVRALADDVDRRVRAGDLARADALAARAELLQAEVEQQDAAQRMQAAQQRWALLTGLTVAPAATAGDPGGDGVPDTHPELEAARLQVEAARRRVESADREKRDPPEIGARLRRESDATGSASAVGVSLRIPFGTDPRTAPAIAQARADFDLALADEQRTRDRLTLDAQAARVQVQSASRQLAAERTRAGLLRQRADLIDRSFRAGESALPDLLRALAAAAQADAAVVRQQAALERARARLAQSLGILP